MNNLLPRSNIILNRLSDSEKPREDIRSCSIGNPFRTRTILVGPAIKDNSNYAVWVDMISHFIGPHYFTLVTLVGQQLFKNTVDSYLTEVHVTSCIPWLNWA